MAQKLCQGNDVLEEIKEAREKMTAEKERMSKIQSQMDYVSAKSNYRMYGASHFVDRSKKIP